MRQRMVDRIGGNIKRYVRQKILSQGVNVNNSENFVNAAATGTLDIHVNLVNFSDITRINKTNGLIQIIKCASPIKDIKKHHSFEVQQKKKRRSLKA